MSLRRPFVKLVIYKCSVCERGESDGITRELLVVKKVTFQEMGSGARMIRSRVVAWLCPTCRDSDIDWNREKATDS